MKNVGLYPSVIEGHLYYEANDQVDAKSFADWITVWWDWLFSIPEQESPLYSSEYTIRSTDYNQGRVPVGWPNTAKDRVWFLCGAYQIQTSVEARTIIPYGQYPILGSVYNMGASAEEFPSLTQQQLKDLVTRDVDGVFEKKVILDGEDLGKAVQRVQTDWFNVTNIPDDNILALDVDSIKMISDGHWFFLKPLHPGDHYLEMIGKSRNYVSTKVYNITVRGPNST